MLVTLIAGCSLITIQHFENSRIQTEQTKGLEIER